MSGSGLRLAPIDIVRGAVMVFMALDHVRDFVTNVRFSPEDLSRSTAALFATRWITHFCAPAFFLLAGIGIGIVLQRGREPWRASRDLVARGVWLLILELVITPIGWQFGFRPVPAFALVLWALGWSMIVMALLVHVPRRVGIGVAVLIIFGHNLLDPIRPDALGGLSWLWRVLHVPGFLIPGVLFIAYPLVPWVAVMWLGHGLAAVYQWRPAERSRLLTWAGAAAFLLFVLLRWFNAYGNPAPWVPQRTPGLTVASFLNLLKYPPSLQFLLMTLGPVLLALALAERFRGRVANWLAVYGRVPLFFYVAHIFVAHAAAVLLALVQGGELRRIAIITDSATLPDWYGVPLPGVVVCWLLVVLVLYYPCRLMARLKESRTDWWLRYV